MLDPQNVFDNLHNDLEASIMDFSEKVLKSGKVHSNKDHLKTKKDLLMKKMEEMFEMLEK